VFSCTSLQSPCTGYRRPLDARPIRHSILVLNNTCQQKGDKKDRLHTAKSVVHSRAWNAGTDMTLIPTVKCTICTRARTFDDHRSVKQTGRKLTSLAPPNLARRYRLCNHSNHHLEQPMKFPWNHPDISSFQNSTAHIVE
jgi:hypothetical protein